MSRVKTIVSADHQAQATYKAYVSGFILSLILTLSAYFMVVNHVLNQKWALAGIVGGLALIQAVTQLILFLHLGKESKPKFRLLVFGFMLSVALILIGGSIWIMHNLNYRMTPSQINNYMQQQDGGL